jgi:hypothetical protein
MHRRIFFPGRCRMLARGRHWWYHNGPGRLHREDWLDLAILAAVTGFVWVWMLASYAID